MNSLFEVILAQQDPRPWLALGHSPNVYTEYQGVCWTPLHLAAYLGLPAVAESLLEAQAYPNSLSLPAEQPGPFQGMVDMTPLDLSLSLGDEATVTLLVRYGGRPARIHPADALLKPALERAHCVGMAEQMVVEPLLLPRVEEAQAQGRWHEADLLLLRIMRHEGETEKSMHLRIRGQVARGLLDDAMQEASLIFLGYRRRGQYRLALQVARAMRRIDPQASRPYELELEYLCALGLGSEARECLNQLVALYSGQARYQEATEACARFDILMRRPENSLLARLPQPWTAPHSDLPAQSGNLPALVEEDDEQPWNQWF